MRQKDFLRLTLISTLIYSASYFTRLNYPAALAEIVRETGASNTEAGLAVTLAFLSYGAGQLIFGILGDRLPARVILASGLVGSALCNLGIYFAPSVPLMVGIWAFNGLFQAMLWPPLVRLLAMQLSSDQYNRAVFYVIGGASLTTVLIYLFVPACIALGSWRLSFLLPAVFALVMAVTAFFALARGEKPSANDRAPAPNAAPKAALLPVCLASGLGAVMLGILLQGMLRDGVSTWMPTYIHEVFQADTTLSILVTSLLPLASILTNGVAGALGSRLRNDVQAAGVLFAVAMTASALLLPLYRVMALPAVLLMTVISCCAHGINYLLVVRLPNTFRDTGRVSTFSGLMNAATYLGSALSVYLVAWLCEHYGWGLTFGVWVGIGLAGLTACLLNSRRWKRYAERHTS